MSSLVRRPAMKTATLRGLVGIAVVSWMISFGAAAQARLVAKGDDPPSNSGTDDGSAPAALDCSLDQNSSCIYNRGGLPAYENGICVCYLSVWVPRQVTNAEKGDVGLVPIAGNDGGDPVVRAALGALGQAHRHSVMFYDNGQKIRHDTMYADQIEVNEPWVGKVSLDADQLRNGTPGAISQSIDDAFADGSLVDDGLLLKPGSSYINLFTGEKTDARPLFKDAVDLAIATPAYYKLSDYTDMTSMLLPWRSSGVGDLRGSHCSGYISWAFGQVGLAITPVSYDEDVRRDVAGAVHDAVVDSVNESLDGKSGLGTFVVHLFKPNAAENIANQVVNCFAGLDCASTDPDWRTLGPGDGLASSPDNLLPSTTSPFKSIEAQVIAGGYYGTTRLTSW